jgi:hypothetical protein
MGMMTAGAQYAAARADYNAKAAQWTQNVVNAEAAARDEQSQNLLRQMQEERASNQKIHLQDIEEAEKKSQVVVASADAGVSGLSVDNLIADIGRSAAYNRQVERDNWKMTAAQLQKEMDATETRMMNRINSVPRPTAPSAGAYLLGGLAGGIKGLGGAM